MPAGTPGKDWPSAMAPSTTVPANRPPFTPMPRSARPYASAGASTGPMEKSRARAMPSEAARGAQALGQMAQDMTQPGQPPLVLEPARERQRVVGQQHHEHHQADAHPHRDAQRAGVLRHLLAKGPEEAQRHQPMSAANSSSLHTATEPSAWRKGMRWVRDMRKQRTNSPSFPGSALWVKAPMATKW